jgi:hypothetical protein
MTLKRRRSPVSANPPESSPDERDSCVRSFVRRAPKLAWSVRCRRHDDERRGPTPCRSRPPRCSSHDRRFARDAARRARDRGPARSSWDPTACRLEAREGVLAYLAPALVLDFPAAGRITAGLFPVFLGRPMYVAAGSLRLSPPCSRWCKCSLQAHTSYGSLRIERVTTGNACPTKSSDFFSVNLRVSRAFRIGGET